jgi:mRNA interferase MazF
MHLCRGDIYIANLNPVKKNNEMGKIRPVLIYQNNELNQSDYPTTIILPLSTHLIDDAEPLRYRITKRDKLKEDSDVVLTQIRAIDNDRLIEKVASVSLNELQDIKKLFDEITI